MPTIYDKVSPSTLHKRILKAESEWEDASAVKAGTDLELRPKAATFRGLIQNSTAKLEALKDRKRTNALDIAWLEACQDTSIIRTNVFIKGIPCDYSGWEIGTNKQTVYVKDTISETFAVPAEFYDNLFTPEEMFTRSYRKAMKNIAEKVNMYCTAQLMTFASFNEYKKGLGLGAFIGADAWKLTSIPYMNTRPTSLNSYLSMVSRVNKMNVPKLYEGGILETFDEVGDSGEVFKFGNAEVYSDIDMPVVTGEDNDMFYVSRGAIGLFHTNNYDNTVPLKDDGENFSHITFSAPLIGNFADANGNKVIVDITQSRKRQSLLTPPEFASLLSSDGRCQVYNIYNLEVKLSMYVNPLACQKTNNGVIHFKVDNTRSEIITPSTPIRMIS